MWDWLQSKMREQDVKALEEARQRLKTLEQKVNAMERDLNARDVEWTEMTRRMAAAAKRASGALGGRPRKDDQDDEQLEITDPEIERVKRRQRILAISRRS